MSLTWSTTLLSSTKAFAFLMYPSISSKVCLLLLLLFSSSTFVFNLSVNPHLSLDSVAKFTNSIKNFPPALVMLPNSLDCLEVQLTRPVRKIAQKGRMEIQGRLRNPHTKAAMPTAHSTSSFLEASRTLDVFGVENETEVFVSVAVPSGAIQRDDAASSKAAWESESCIALCLRSPGRRGEGPTVKASEPVRQMTAAVAPRERRERTVIFLVDCFVWFALFGVLPSRLLQVPSGL
mmetsp:Transcript_44638/g.88219  ORF Transcript_44638/g.88219 Transcript_44638/m.88219 type:complete len:235 (-) Transcript_44638:100-804(-)